MIKNKKGADKIISVYWFVVLFLVAGAIVYMVASFYGKPYDIREIEANILTDKVANCVSYSGEIRNGVLSSDDLTEEFKNNFLDFCDLTFNVEDSFGWKSEEQYFIQIGFYDFENYPGSNFLFGLSTGNFNLKQFCGQAGSGMPICLEREFYSLGENGKKYVIKINSIVKKIEKNA